MRQDLPLKYAPGISPRSAAPRALLRVPYSLSRLRRGKSYGVARRASRHSSRPLQMVSRKAQNSGGGVIGPDLALEMLLRTYAAMASSWYSGTSSTAGRGLGLRGTGPRRDEGTDLSWCRTWERVAAKRRLPSGRVTCAHSKTTASSTEEAGSATPPYTSGVRLRAERR